MKNYHQAGTCSQRLTEGIPNTLNVFGSCPHMHLIGKQLWTEHYRDGNYLGTMGASYNYDFNSQRFYNINATIEKGDTV